MVLSEEAKRKVGVPFCFSNKIKDITHSAVLYWTVLNLWLQAYRPTPLPSCLPTRPIRSRDSRPAFISSLLIDVTEPTSEFMAKDVGFNYKSHG